METGVSDYHALIFSFLKSALRKSAMHTSCNIHRNYIWPEANSFLKDVENLPATIGKKLLWKNWIKPLLSNKKDMRKIVTLLLQKIWSK